MNAEAKFVAGVMDARLKKAKRERDSFRKQRDELINDMAEVKRKTEAWDKLKEYVLDRNEAFSDRKDCAQSPQQFEYFENLLTAFKVIKTKMNDLERGSDESRKTYANDANAK